MGEEPEHWRHHCFVKPWAALMLDPYATLDDVEELANFILREYDPRTGDWSHIHNEII